MQTIISRTYGKPEVIHVKKIDTPAPRGGEALIHNYDGRRGSPRRYPLTGSHNRQYPPSKGNTMKLTREHRPASRPGKTAAALLLVVAGFQASLASGAPWGAAAYGGVNPGVLPDSLRASSAVSAVIYLVLAAVAGTSWVPVGIRRRVMYGTCFLMVVGAVLNIASPSFIERIIWVPVTILLVITLWRTARLDAAPVLRKSAAPVTMP